VLRGGVYRQAVHPQVEMTATSYQHILTPSSPSHHHAKKNPPTQKKNVSTPNPLALYFSAVPSVECVQVLYIYIAIYTLCTQHIYTHTKISPV
jgi:hypothetical protein